MSCCTCMARTAQLLFVAKQRMSKSWQCMHAQAHTLTSACLENHPCVYHPDRWLVICHSQRITQSLILHVHPPGWVTCHTSLSWRASRQFGRCGCARCTRKHHRRDPCGLCLAPRSSAQSAKAVMRALSGGQRHGS